MHIHLYVEDIEKLILKEVERRTGIKEKMVIWIVDYNQTVEGVNVPIKKEKEE